MVYGLLADVVMVTHFAFIVFLPVGALLTWRWPRLVWVHLPTAVYGLVIITVGFTCPLTPLERSLRVRAGERAFTGGFVNHYIEGVIYPQRYAGLIRGLVVVVMVVGYAGLAVRLRRRALVARSQRQDRAAGGCGSSSRSRSRRPPRRPTHPRSSRRRGGAATPREVSPAVVGGRERPRLHPVLHALAHGERGDDQRGRRVGPPPPKRAV